MLYSLNSLTNLSQHTIVLHCSKMASIYDFYKWWLIFIGMKQKKNILKKKKIAERASMWPIWLSGCPTLKKGWKTQKVHLYTFFELTCQAALRSRKGEKHKKCIFIRFFGVPKEKIWKKVSGYMIYIIKFFFWKFWKKKFRFFP